MQTIFTNHELKKPQLNKYVFSTSYNQIAKVFGKSLKSLITLIGAILFISTINSCTRRFYLALNESGLVDTDIKAQYIELLNKQINKENLTFPSNSFVSAIRIKNIQKIKKNIKLIVNRF
ncbi:hypothetical protein ACTFIV_005221 [Dictyostelium citrinum]